MARFTITDQGLNELEDPSSMTDRLELQALSFLAQRDDLSPNQLAVFFRAVGVDPLVARNLAGNTLIELVKLGYVAPMGTASLRARVGRRVDRRFPASLSETQRMSTLFLTEQPTIGMREGPATLEDIQEEEL